MKSIEIKIEGLEKDIVIPDIVRKGLDSGYARIQQATLSPEKMQDKTISRHRRSRGGN